MKRRKHAVNQNEPKMVDNSISNKLQRAGSQLLDMVFPPTCLLCDQAGDGMDLCASCRADLPAIRFACYQCGLPLQNRNDSHCGRCLNDTPAYDHTVAPWRYQFPVDKLIQQYKFHRKMAVSRMLSTLLVEALQEEEQPQALIPVPLHRWRLITRGFNQSQCIARDLSKALGIPVLNQAMRKTKKTPAQASLPLKQRKRSLKGVFAVSRSANLPKHIALVDDVMTTGSTAHECARCLKAAGVDRVDVWVVARTP